jgi:hypothetical protein
VTRPTLPAISLWQPWASFIAIGVKQYETRHWRPPSRFIGQRIAIHAAKRRLDKDDVEWWHLVSKSDDLPPLGAYVCTAILRACLPADRVAWDEFGDYGDDRFAWYLTDVEPIDPAIPAVGHQGFWTWEREPS